MSGIRRDLFSGSRFFFVFLIFRPVFSGCLRGGLGGVYIRTTGRKGEVRVTITSDQAEAVTVEMNVTEALLNSEEQERQGQG